MNVISGSYQLESFTENINSEVKRLKSQIDLCYRKEIELTGILKGRLPLNMIPSAFKIKLSLRIFFDSPRIRDLGEIIDIAKQKETGNVPDLSEKDHPNITKGQI